MGKYGCTGQWCAGCRDSLRTVQWRLNRGPRGRVVSVDVDARTSTFAQPSWGERFELGRTEVKSIVGKAWPYLLVGIGLGAIVHGWAPTDFFARYAGPDSPLACPSPC